MLAALAPIIGLALQIVLAIIQHVFDLNKERKDDAKKTLETMRDSAGKNPKAFWDSVADFHGIYNK